MAVSKARILVIVEPQADERPAVARGAWLAKLLRRDLELFICEDDGARARSPEQQARMLDEDLGIVANIAASLGHVETDISTDARWARWLDEGILRKVHESKPFLVVKDAHSPSPMRQALFSNTDWSLVRECPVPLLLVRPRLWQPRRVLAAVDPVHPRDPSAALDLAIVDFACELTRASAGELHIAHFFEPAPSRPAAVVGATVRKPQERECEPAHRDALHDLLRRCDLEPGATLHFAPGDPRERLPALAEEVNAGFTVLGALKRGADSLAIGSTAEHALERMPSDVIVVKPTNPVSPIDRPR